uniref:Uncharacterized protein n=1 Tax=Rhizophora mucronata TaxID=61149 RepID=A0A2P2K5V4_RHIMU
MAGRHSVFPAEGLRVTGWLVRQFIQFYFNYDQFIINVGFTNITKLLSFLNLNVW